MSIEDDDIAKRLAALRGVDTLPTDAELRERFARLTDREIEAPVDAIDEADELMLDAAFQIKFEAQQKVVERADHLELEKRVDALTNYNNEPYDKLVTHKNSLESHLKLLNAARKVMDTPAGIQGMDDQITRCKRKLDGVHSALKNHPQPQSTTSPTPPRHPTSPPKKKKSDAKKLQLIQAKAQALQQRGEAVDNFRGNNKYTRLIKSALKLSGKSLPQSMSVLLGIHTTLTREEAMIANQKQLIGAADKVLATAKVDPTPEPVVTKDDTKKATPTTEATRDQSDQKSTIEPASDADVNSTTESTPDAEQPDDLTSLEKELETDMSADSQTLSEYTQDLVDDSETAFDAALEVAQEQTNAFEKTSTQETTTTSRPGRQWIPEIRINPEVLMRQLGQEGMKEFARDPQSVISGFMVGLAERIQNHPDLSHLFGSSNQEQHSSPQLV
ncbi:MAG: hypothetical protein COB66_06730 [Coxiella sp. (in: Bacteria)]|nr:MAG: hypothetical protein COB66_06730 [Coxiella sp. (in: g-proteobacteria)]